MDTENQKAKTRKLSTQEGAIASVMVGISDSYIIPYALELKATNLQVGLISSLANLFGPMAQIFGSRLMEKTNRKKIVVAGVVAQASSWFLFIILGLIFLAQGPSFYLTPLVILAFVIYSLSGAIAGPAWFSLMGDVVPEKIRGKYFSRRTKFSTITSVTTTIISAFLLYYFSRINIIIGFLILFLTAAAARYISAFLLNRHYVEEITLEKEYYFSFWQFIKEIPRLNFNRFALFTSLITLGANIAGPFFSVYMWKELHFNPIEFTAVNVAAGIFSFLFLPLWGKFADTYGNRETLRLAAILVIPLPIFWLFGQSPIYLILVPQLFSGLGWSAFNLATSNFIYDSIGQQRRGLVVAYYTLLNGIGIFIGALLGGLIAQYAKVDFINIFFLIFIISSLSRLLAAVIMLPKIQEVKNHYRPANKNPLLYFKEIKSVYFNIINNFYPLDPEPFVSYFRRRKK